MEKGYKFTKVKPLSKQGHNSDVPRSRCVKVAGSHFPVYVFNIYKKFILSCDSDRKFLSHNLFN